MACFDTGLTVGTNLGICPPLSPKAIRLGVVNHVTSNKPGKAPLRGHSGTLAQPTAVGLPPRHLPSLVRESSAVV
jgi:hypothetical protein